MGLTHFDEAPTREYALGHEEEVPVHSGHVISRPPGTGVAHALRAEDELTYLAYGTRNSSDVRYYPRSQKLVFGGLGVVARIDRIDYWDGED